MNQPRAVRGGEHPRLAARQAEQHASGGGTCWPWLEMSLAAWR